MDTQNSYLNKHFTNDTVFNEVQKTFISLPEEKKKKNNACMNEAIETLISKMKKVDSIFDKTFRTTLYRGSFYKGTKITAPEEYDLNLVIKLPIKDTYFHTDEYCYPGYTKIYVKSFSNSPKFSEKEFCKLKTFLSNSYLNVQCFRAWIESVICKALNISQTENGQCILNTDIENKSSVTIRKSGPAFTVILKSLDNQEINVDLVPVLTFNDTLPYITEKEKHVAFKSKTWSVVPKPLYKWYFDEDMSNSYWRFCFYEQEKELLDKYGQIKPVIMQIKKLKDTHNWKPLASYYIETLALHEIMRFSNIQKLSKTSLLMMMLERLRDACKLHKLDWFWNENCNLFEKLNDDFTKNVSNRLDKYISHINKYIETDRYIIAYYMLTAEEYEILKSLQQRLVLPSFSDESDEAENSSDSEPEVLELINGFINIFNAANQLYQAIRNILEH
ncbi:hypothetical protein KM043_010766 [Ampulex compressa]|nr:hypothetical protein KM043_010766 [Ampulex compressa]